MIVNAASLFTTLKMKIVKQFVMSTIGIQGWGAEGAAVTRPPLHPIWEGDLPFSGKIHAIFWQRCIQFLGKSTAAPSLGSSPVYLI